VDQGLTVDFDLHDPGLVLRADVVADPRAFYDTLRRRAPVWQIPGQDTFLVSDPGLIRDAVGRPDDFSSNLVSLLHDDGRGCPIPMQITRFRDPIHVLATADPPRHTAHRRLLQPHLSPNEVAALEPRVREIVREHLEPAVASGRVDAVASFADVVPARTVCELIGLPHDDAVRISQLVLDTGALLDGVTRPDGMVRAAEAAIALTAYVHEQLDAALARPRNARVGLLAVFSDAIAAGEISSDEVRDMLVTLVSAGSETTASLIATAVATLARDAGLQSSLRADPSKIPDTIEQVLRDDGPFQFHYRYVPADTTLGGVDIPAESRVLLMWAAANRPRPEALERESPSSETGRGLPPHYAFGKGMHFCIGAPVARLEARVALEELLAHTASIGLDPDDPPTRRPSIFIRRHRSLPIILERR
jgi:cytochrome P450